MTTAALPSLLFLNRCYWPDTEATGQLLTDLCESLTDRFDVHVVCGQPNSPAPGATFRSTGVEERGGVTIHRLRHSRFAKRVPAGRLLNLASFSLAAERYLRRSPLRVDCVVSETDPFLLPIVASRHARRVNSRLVSYLQDIYPDVAEAIGKVKPGPLTRQIRRSLRRAYVASDRVIVLGECMKRRLESSPWGIDPAKLCVLPNWADCSSIAPVGRETNSFLRDQGLIDRFVVMHSGNMGLTQRLDVLLAAAADSAWPEAAVLVLVGDGAMRLELEALAASLPEGRVRVLPYQPRERLAESLSAADLHIVSMHESITGCLCPSKLYGILAAGRPVLAVAMAETDLCTTVSQHAVGDCQRPGDAAAIARSVASLASDPERTRDAGMRARTLALEQFDQPIVTEAFARLLQDVVGKEPSQRG